MPTPDDDASGDRKKPENQEPEPFTTAQQKKIDVLLGERAKRAEESAVKELLRGIELESQDDLRAIVKAARKATDDQKTEVEKLQTQVSEAQNASEKAANEAKAIADAAVLRVMNSEIKIAASVAVADKDGKITRPAFRPEALGDVVLLIGRDAIKEKDGEFSGIEEALAELAKVKPYLLSEAQTNTERAKGTPPRKEEKSKARQQEAPPSPSFKF